MHGSQDGADELPRNDQGSARIMFNVNALEQTTFLSFDNNRRVNIIKSFRFLPLNLEKEFARVGCFKVVALRLGTQTHTAKVHTFAHQQTYHTRAHTHTPLHKTAKPAYLSSTRYTGLCLNVLLCPSLSLLLPTPSLQCPTPPPLLLLLLLPPANSSPPNSGPTCSA